MRFDFRDLEQFIAVAQTGSIARAAERSNTVASAVSKRLSDLEAACGVSLLVRGAKGVELTSAGHAFLARARSVLQQGRQLEEEMRLRASGSHGHVRVFANISAIVEFLPGALAGFLARHPDIHVHLEEHVSSIVVAGVADNLADVGIASSLPAIEGVTATPFRTDELVIVMRAEHALAGRHSVTFAEVASLPFVGLHAESSLHQLLAGAAADHNKQLNVRIRVTSFDAVCGMVAAGLGIAAVPRAAAAPGIQQMGLVALQLADPWARRQLFLCTRTGAALPAAAGLLFEHLLAAGANPAGRGGAVAKGPESP